MAARHNRSCPTHNLRNHHLIPVPGVLKGVLLADGRVPTSDSWVSTFARRAYVCATTSSRPNSWERAVAQACVWRSWCERASQNVYHSVVLVCDHDSGSARLEGPPARCLECPGARSHGLPIWAAAGRARASKPCQARGGARSQPSDSRHMCPGFEHLALEATACEARFLLTDPSICTSWRTAISGTVQGVALLLAQPVTSRKMARWPNGKMEQDGSMGDGTLSVLHLSPFPCSFGPKL